MPLKISEQVITKNLEGETTTYKALMPGKMNKKISLSKLSNVWEDLDEVNKHLLDNANTAITNMLSETIDIENKYFLEKVKNNLDKNDACTNDPKNDTIKNNEDHVEDKSIIKVDLGNGQIGNLKVDNNNLDQKKK